MEKTKFDYKELRILILRKYESVLNFCNTCGFSTSTISRMLDGQMYPRIDSVYKVAEALDIDKKDYGFYFFTKKVA